MLYPQVRTALLPIDGQPGLNRVAFCMPDRHGIHKFVLDYRRRGWTTLRAATNVPIVPLPDMTVQVLNWLQLGMAASRDVFSQADCRMGTRKKFWSQSQRRLIFSVLLPNCNCCYHNIAPYFSSDKPDGAMA